MSIKCLMLALLPLCARSLSACMFTLNAFRACAEDSSCDCNLVPLISDGFQDDLCTNVAESVCSVEGCCPPCEQEYLEYEGCLEHFITTSLQPCHIDCDVTTVAPAPAPSLVANPETTNIFSFEDTSRETRNLVSLEDTSRETRDVDEFEFCMPNFLSATSCIHENNEDCSDCEVLGPPFQLLETEFCETATNKACAMLKCCDECQEQLEDYAYCVQDFVLEATTGDCELSCSSVDSEAPTPSPGEKSPIPTMGISDSTGCLSVLNVATRCVGNHDCHNCFLADLPDDPQDPTFCSDTRNVYCSQNLCCPACQLELDAYEACLGIYAIVATDSECEMDCSTPPPAPPNALLTEGVDKTQDSSSASRLRIYFLVLCSATFSLAY